MNRLFFSLTILVLLAAQTIFAQKADLTVAADGSGDFKTVQEAIDKVPENNKKRFTILIKPGVYQEQVKIPATKPYISLIGEKAETTKITFKISNKEAGSTSAAFAFYVAGHDFYAENLTFENSFGLGSQAVAVVSDADRAIFSKCRFLAWQDTLYTRRGRQYFKDSYIEGSVDFIFGQATAVFENSQIHSKTNGYVTAPMRFAADEPSGLVFDNCKLTAESTVKGVYLGRPWRAFGRTVFLNTEMGEFIKPEGWHNWGKTENEQTAYFAEYKSSGKGGNQENRVKWMHQLSESEAQQFTAENFLKGSDRWNPKGGYSTISSQTPEAFKPVEWGSAILKIKPIWYPTDEAVTIANQLVVYQKENGGWEKNINNAELLTVKEKEVLIKKKSENKETTIDNRTTFSHIAYLAKVITALSKSGPTRWEIPVFKESFFKGLDYLLKMQYENGGFPQFYPLKKGYYTHITYNDDAMIGVLNAFQDIANKQEDYLFVDEERRSLVEKGFNKGLALTLQLQVVIDGKKTIWAAQYDENTLKPTNARAYEPASLSGGESVNIVRFLMSIKNPDAQTIEAVEAAIEWYRQNKLEGVRLERKQTDEGWKYSLIKDSAATPLWGRFYQIETMKPIFVGRDAVIKYDISKIAPERAGGYTWLVSNPLGLIEKEYPKWKKGLAAK